MALVQWAETSISSVLGMHNLHLTLENNSLSNSAKNTGSACLSDLLFLSLSLAYDVAKCKEVLLYF